MLNCHILRFDSLEHIYRFYNRILFSECRVGFTPGVSFNPRQVHSREIWSQELQYYPFLEVY